MYIEAFKEKSQLNMNENIVWMFHSSSVYLSQMGKTAFCLSLSLNYYPILVLLI